MLQRGAVTELLSLELVVMEDLEEAVAVIILEQALEAVMEMLGDIPHLKEMMEVLANLEVLQEQAAVVEQDQREAEMAVVVELELTHTHLGHQQQDLDLLDIMQAEELAELLLMEVE